MSQSRTALATAPPRLEFRVPPEGSHLLRARERLRDYLSRYCAERELVDDVVLCVEEACTNAIRHSGSSDDIGIALEFTGGRLVAFVRDSGRGFDTTGFDRRDLPDLTVDHGRGLFIIANLMDDLELCCRGGCEVRMARKAAPRCAVQPLETGLGEMRAAVRPERQRETRLRALLEEIDEAFVAVDWEYRCVHANGAALQLVGLSLEEMLGRRPWELFSQPGETALERAYRDAMELGMPSTIEQRSATTGGWLEARVYPTPAGVSAYLRQIDARKRTEEDRERLLEAYELELSRTSLLGDVARAAASSLGLKEICERVLEQIHAHADLRAAAIYVIDQEKGALRSLALFGHPDDTASGLHDLPLSDESACGRLLVHGLPELVGEADGDPAAGVVRPPTPGERHWLALPITHQGDTLGAMTLLPAAPGSLASENVEVYRSVAATLGTAIANARSYQTEVEAQEILRRYELLAAEARDAMLFVRGRDGRIIEANRAAESVYGYTRDELLRLSIRDLRAEGTHDLIGDQMAAATHLGVLFETLHRRRDGSVFPVEISSRGTTAMAGEMVLLSIVRDVTERHAAEKALRDSERRTTAELGFSNTLLRAAETLSSSMQIDTVLDRLAQLLVEAVHAGRLVVLLWDHVRSEISVALAKGDESFPVETVWSCDDVDTIPLVDRLVPDLQVRTIDFEAPDVPDEVRRVTVPIGMRLALAVPIVARGELFGFVGLDERDGRREFTGREIELARAICDQAAAALDNARLYEQEHDVALELRAALLKLPDEIPGLTFAHHYRPAVQPAHVGGDFYDLFELAHGLVGVMVGDISGKGIEAAVLTSLVKNTIRAHATEKGKTPADVVALTNTVLARETAAETFATVFFAMLDRRDGRLVYCNAGHPASVVARADGTVAILPATSPLIGTWADFPFRNAESFLSCEDLLFLYTDGLTEARRDQRQFGEQRLLEMVGRLCRHEPDEVVERVVASAGSFADGGLRDDLAVLALRRRELPGPSQQKLRLD